MTMVHARRYIHGPGVFVLRDWARLVGLMPVFRQQPERSGPRSCLSSAADAHCSAKPVCRVRERYGQAGYLRAVLQDYAGHYIGHRPHQSRNQRATRS
jgi:hypothetical protein